MKHTSHYSLLLVASGVLVTALGCSVVNSFDELQEGVTSGGSSGSGGTAGSGATAGNGAQGGSAGTAASGGTAGSAGTGGSGGVDAPPGLIVVLGEGDLEAGGRGTVVSALSPYDGSEYDRREFGPNLSGRVAYDAQEDLWYVWTQKGTVLEFFDLHTWSFDRKERKFVSINTASVPAPLGVIAVLNRRILYWSTFREGAGAPTNGFTILNTDKPDDVTVVMPVQDIPTFGGASFAAIPRPNSSGEGGNVNLFLKSATCAPGAVLEGGNAVEMCDVEVRLLTIQKASSKPSYGTPRVLGSIRQNGGGASAVKASAEDAVAFPDPLWEDTGSNTATAGSVERFQSVSHGSVAMVPFSINGPTVRGAAWDPCNKLYFATELSKDTAIFAVPTVAGGTAFRQGVATAPVANIFFDQYTRTIFQPKDSPANFEFRAFAVGGTSTAPTLTERDPNSAEKWAPPSDLRPINVALEEPVTQFCPN